MSSQLTGTRRRSTLFPFLRFSLHHSKTVGHRVGLADSFDHRLGQAWYMSIFFFLLNFFFSFEFFFSDTELETEKFTASVKAQQPNLSHL